MFATRAIRKGAPIIEYVGERISHEEADRRHSTKAADDNHTFLFTVDSKTVIDGGVGGNAARFINHSCEPNCEVIIDDGRLFVEAARTIRSGEEIVYDYMITRAPDDAPDLEQIFGCRCGAATCRGTMLEPRKKPKASKKKAGGRKSKSKASSNGRKPKSTASSNGRKPKSTASPNGRKSKSTASSNGPKSKSTASSNGPKSKSTASSNGRRGALPRRKTGQTSRGRRSTASSSG
ncbi:MAG: SET domain-containing protein-lysine N-methyltransferase [Myxococcales bacterium]|nr:SET domain-containing protein-lysine N-methyltransferase [Myxococcales bacterium]